MGSQERDKGMSDTEWFHQLAARRERERAEALRAAKAAAPGRGKEPFDFEKLCKLYDVTSDLAPADREPDPAAADHFETKYYLWYEDVMTVEEFAKRLEQLDIYNP